MDIGSLLVGSGLGGILLAIVKAFLDRRKMGADTASVLSKAAIELVKPLSDRIHELDDEVEKLRAKVQGLTADLERSQARVRELEEAQRN